jgi:hypothetical protein
MQGDDIAFNRTLNNAREEAGWADFASARLLMRQGSPAPFLSHSSHPPFYTRAISFRQLDGEGRLPGSRRFRDATRPAEEEFGRPSYPNMPQVRPRCRVLRSRRYTRHQESPGLVPELQNLGAEQHRHCFHALELQATSERADGPTDLRSRCARGSTGSPLSATTTRRAHASSGGAHARNDRTRR